MEYYIRKVEIKGLFDKERNYTIELTEGCNCLYGSNGTGKTTIINLIVNCLNVDIAPLAKTPFEIVSIFLAKSKQKRPIKFLSVKKTSNTDNKTFGTFNIEYNIDGQPPTNFVESIRTLGDRPTEKYPQETEQTKGIISTKVNLTHVPLLRMHDADIPGMMDTPDEFLLSALRQKRMSQSDINEIMDPSVRVLNSLQRHFMTEANEYRKTINTKLEKLKSTIIEKVLIDETLVKEAAQSFINPKNKDNKSNNLNPNEYISRLKDANISVPDKKILDHFEIWERLNQNVVTYKKEWDEARNNKVHDAKKEHELMQKMNDSYFGLFVATHFNKRFSSIVKDVENMQEEKSILTKAFREYEEEINNYLNPKKTFLLNEDGKFTIKSGKREIKPSELSSGEKHILTILGRAALNNKQGAVFVADEPELSLHLDWQRMILPSIMKLSPRSQIIVATHSPAIFPTGANEIDLEECINNAVN